jgi:hypothetical protein
LSWLEHPRREHPRNNNGNGNDNNDNNGNNGNNGNNATKPRQISTTTNETSSPPLADLVTFPRNYTPP